MKRLLFCLCGLTMTFSSGCGEQSSSLPTMPLSDEPAAQTGTQQLGEFLKRNTVGAAAPIQYQKSREFRDVINIISQNSLYQDTIVLNFNEDAVDAAKDNKQNTVQVTTLRVKNARPLSLNSLLRPLDGINPEVLLLMDENSPMIYIDSRELNGTSGITIEPPPGTKVEQKDAVLTIRKGTAPAREL